MSEFFSDLHLIHFLPVLTTVVAAFFLFHIFRRYLQKGGTHLLWWSIGVFTYGLGTFLESMVSILGNGPFLNKTWYVAGAILGGYPLAQGSVYLHFSKRTADLMTAVTVPFVVLASIFVLLSPTDLTRLEMFRPGGGALAWQWVRGLTPIVNGYAAIFLIGSAVLSAVRFARSNNGFYRALGNTLIASGAILPGIGGGMAKGGFVEALYIGEFVGIILIFAGYLVCRKDSVTLEQLTEGGVRSRRTSLDGPSG